MAPALLLACALALAPPGPDGGAPAPPPEPDFRSVDALLEKALPADGGGVVRVGRPRHVLFEKAYGGYRIDDAIHIGSGTRLLSTVVLLSLVDDGMLSLDSTVSAVVRDWPKDKAAITLRMLLADTSGLPPSTRCLEDRSVTLETCVQEIAGLQLRRDPGTAVIYGATGFQVAGRMAELVSRKSWADLFRERLTRPLGLRVTGFGRTANPRIAGGAQTNAGEYGAVLDVLLEEGAAGGVRLLSAASVAAMFQDQSRAAPLVHSPYSLVPGRESMRPGLGVWLDRTDGQVRGVEALCQGAFGFTAWLDRERRLDGVLLVKSDLRRILPLEQQMRAQIRRLVPPPAGER